MTMRRHPIDLIALTAGLILGAIGLLAVLRLDRTRSLDLTLLTSGGIVLLGAAIVLSSLAGRRERDR
jgi:hypothetical protein